MQKWWLLKCYRFEPCLNHWVLALIYFNNTPDRWRDESMYLWGPMTSAVWILSPGHGSCCSNVCLWNQSLGKSWKWPLLFLLWWIWVLDSAVTIVKTGLYVWAVENEHYVCADTDTVESVRSGDDSLTASLKPVVMYEIKGKAACFKVVLLSL